MSDSTRAVFSLPLYASFQALIVLGYSLRPCWYRPLFFIPIAFIALYLVFYTTTGTIADVGLGGSIISQMLYAFDGIVLTDVQRALCRIGETPGQIISNPFMARLAWGWHLHNSPRGVGWKHELTHIPKNPPSLNSPRNRKAFVLSRLYMVGICVSVQAAFYFVNAANPALAPGATPLFHQSLYIRALSTCGLGIPAMAQINLQHCILSVILVSLGISQPADWPPLFGSPLNMYTVQGFWRNVWHQLLRKPLLAATHFIIHTILRIPQTSTKSSPLTHLSLGFLKLHTAFFVSALVHAAGEFMMLGHGGNKAFTFFILQPWAITLEIAIRYLINRSTTRGGGERRRNDKPPTLIWRLLGYIWVISWFISVAPLMQQPMVEAGLFLGTPGSAFTQKVGRWLALDVI